MRNTLFDLSLELPLVSEKNIPYLKLFHYTSNESKEKIIKDDYIDFRLTRAEDFLDKNEGTQILEPFHHACGILYENDEIDGDFYGVLHDINADMIRKYNSGAWILCLTPNGNSKYMKSRYAPKDGWIIGLNIVPLEDLCNNFNQQYGEFDLCTVEYSLAKMRDKFLHNLRKIYSYYQKYLKHDEYNSKDKTKSTLREFMIQYISMNCYCYKSSDYKKEEEIRLICYPQPDFSSWESEDGSIKLLMALDNNDPKLHLLLGNRNSLYCCRDKLNWIDSKDLNKNVLQADEIRRCAQKNRTK